jgi:hypothetical protein
VFLDNSTNNFFVTRNGNTTQGTFSPYGGNWSNYFDGTGDYLSIPTTSGKLNQTGDFTYDMWVFWNVMPTTGYQNIAGQGTGGQSSYGLMAGNAASNTWSAPYVFKLNVANSGDVLNGNTTLVAGQWYHLAHTRTSGVNRLFVNGVVQTNTYTDNTSRTFAGNPYLITDGNSNCYMSNFRFIQGTSLYTTSFTPPSTPLTPVTGTQLLTSQSNSLIDNSINNLTITKVGDTTVQRFSPFNPSSVTPTSYSGYFGAANGNDLYLSSQASGSGGVTLSGNYTIEMWLYPTAASGSGYSMLVATNTNGGFFQFYYNSAGNIGYYTPAFGQPTTSSAPLTFNAWQHIALVRSSNSVKVYVNGVEKAFSSTITDSSTIYANYIGGLGTVYNTFGYISNLRITNTAVYTTTFTPSTSPLTAISGTQLLTLQSDKFIDNSTNNYTINVDGSPRPTQQNPFGFTSATTNGYTVSTIGGSGYFDGTGDTLSVPFTSAISLGTGNFTMEAWCYPIINTNGIDSLWGSGNYSVMLYHNGTSWTLEVGDGGGNYFTINGTAPIYAWNHMAVTRSGSTFNLWINGVSAGTGTTAGTMKTSGTLVIGGNGNGQNFTGYISDYRLVKGTALYTSSFVPPSAPLLALQNTTFLSNMTSAGVYDAAMMNNMETVGDAKLSTAISKFGGSSMAFDGTGDYVLSSTSANLYAFGAGDFTIELWVYTNSVAATDQALVDFRTANGYYPYLYLFNGRVGYWLNSVDVITGSPGSITAGSWYHIALTRSGSSTKLFVNGTQSGSTYTSATALLCGVNRPAIGSSGTSLGAYPLNGYVDDLRVTKGYARYTANFTPPTSAFPIY